MNDKGAVAVILNYNDSDRAMQTLRVFLDCVEVCGSVVVDNSPEPSLTGDEPEFSSGRAFFMRVPNEGYAAGNDRGIEAALSTFGESDFIIIANPDIGITPEAVGQCLEFLRGHTKYACVSPRQKRAEGTFNRISGWRKRTVKGDLAYSSGLLARTLGMFHEAYPDSAWETPYTDVDCIAGSFFVIRSQVFKEIGHFDRGTFLFYEEDIIGVKLARKGYRQAILNTCSYTHFEGVSGSTTIKKYLAMQKSRIYYHTRYGGCGAGGRTLLYIATAEGFCEQLLKSALKFFKIKR
jgi:N-acetylglucosaminyl-diphospho-decaprenol L-rhamnosyltransferase